MNQELYTAAMGAITVIGTLLGGFGIWAIKKILPHAIELIKSKVGEKVFDQAWNYATIIVTSLEQKFEGNGEEKKDAAFNFLKPKLKKWFTDEEINHLIESAVLEMNKQRDSIGAQIPSIINNITPVNNIAPDSVIKRYDEMMKGSQTDNAVTQQEQTNTTPTAESAMPISDPYAAVTPTPATTPDATPTVQGVTLQLTPDQVQIIHAAATGQANGQV